VYKLLRKRAGQARLSEELTPHDLRRSFASELFRRKTPTSTVQRMMGHANPATTVRYDRSGEEAEREAAELLHVPYTRRYGGPGR
jgi:integrase